MVSSSMTDEIRLSCDPASGAAILSFLRLQKSFSMFPQFPILIKDVSPLECLAQGFC